MRIRYAPFAAPLLLLSLVALAQPKRAAKEPDERPAGKAPSGKPIVRVLPPPPPPVPDRVGELITIGFKPAGEGLWRSSAGVLVRMRKRGREWLFAELVFDGSTVATRQDDGIKLRAGDVEVRPTTDGFEVRVRKT